MKQICYTRNLSLKYEADVFIAGGGPAGVAAALAAARNGSKVFLCEGQGCLGGMGTAGMVPAFMQFGDGINFLAAGIGEEIYNSLLESEGVGSRDRFAIKAEVLKRVYDRKLLESGVKFMLQTRLIDVETVGNKVTYAVLNGKSGTYMVGAKIFIDCTGDGDLSAMAGAKFEKGDVEGSTMPGTLCALWGGIAWDRLSGSQSSFLRQAFDEGIFTVLDLHHSGVWMTGDCLGGSNIGHAFGVDGTNDESLTKAFIEQRSRMAEYQAYYKKYIAGFEGLELAATAPIMGIRESRRILGDYVLNINDFQNRAVFDDEIGRYCYPVDIHPSTPDAADFEQFRKEYHEKYRYKTGESYGIPYRSLIVRDFENLLVAGKCISSDRGMQGSVRVMPGCYITGQAAGAGAAVAVTEHTHIRGFEIRQLQQALKNMGGYLPNYKD